MNPSELFSLWSTLFDEQGVWDVLGNLDNLLEKWGPWECAIDIPQGAFVKGPISIAEGVRIEPGAYIEGPCRIAEGAYIRHGAYIRGNAYIGKGVVIGHGSEIKNSILFDGAKAAHFNYVGDSIVGKDANLGAGVILANVRHDRNLIKVRGSETGLRKLGALVGDGASVGCNGVANPGTIILKGAKTHPCTALGGVVS